MLCIASAAIAVTRCPSVRLSCSLVAPKRIKISSEFFHHRVAKPFWFFHEGHGVAGWCARTSAQSKQVVERRSSQTVVCRAGCQVDRRASRCHSPGATTPARRPATIVLLVTSTDECCATGVMWRYSDGNPPNGGVECKGVWKNDNFRPISRLYRETVIVRWAHSARQFVSIEFSFHPCNI